MPLYLHKSLFGDKSLTPTSVQIFGYGESPVASLGECTIAIHTGVVFTIEQSSRTDKTKARVFKDAKQVILGLITDIINRSLSTSTFPSDWKDR